MKVICVYHSADLDGICSGAIMRRRFPNALMVPYDYGQAFPHDLIEDGDEVFMADVSLPMDQMAQIALKAGNFTWIDHHVSAYNDYLLEYHGMLPLDLIDVVYVQGKAACELCWEYFSPAKSSLEEFIPANIPAVVRLLADYDVWRNQDPDHWNLVVLPFQYWFRSQVSSLSDFDPDCFSWESVNQEILAGKAIMDYVKKSDEKWALANSFRATVLGHEAVCLNSTRFSSQAFESVNKDCDLMVCFAFTGNKWKFSFYTEKDDVDCSQIAKHFGGGGHRKAAGCVVDDPKMIL